MQRAAQNQMKLIHGVGGLYAILSGNKSGLLYSSRGNNVKWLT